MAGGAVAAEEIVLLQLSPTLRPSVAHVPLAVAVGDFGAARDHADAVQVLGASEAGCQRIGYARVVDEAEGGVDGPAYLPPAAPAHDAPLRRTAPGLHLLHAVHVALQAQDEAHELTSDEDDVVQGGDDDVPLLVLQEQRTVLQQDARQNVGHSSNLLQLRLGAGGGVALQVVEGAVAARDLQQGLVPPRAVGLQLAECVAQLDERGGGKDSGGQQGRRVQLQRHQRRQHRALAAVGGAQPCRPTALAAEHHLQANTAVMGRSLPCTLLIISFYLYLCKTEVE